MKYLTTLLLTLILVSCNSNKAEKTGDQKQDTTTTQTQPAEQNTGKVDLITLGPLKIDQHYMTTSELVGTPANRVAPIAWEADGLMHEDWSYGSKGISINMCFPAGKPEEKKIFSISVTAPCDFKTLANMGIGNTYAEVEAAYKKDIDKEMTNESQIVVGSVYGGIIFNFDESKKVNRVFLGAAAE